MFKPTEITPRAWLVLGAVLIVLGILVGEGGAWVVAALVVVALGVYAFRR